MLHSVVITAHAACALVAFALGLLAVWQPATGVTRVLRAYLGALWLMVVFLGLAVLVDWSGLDTSTRAVFSGLLVLAVYTGWRGSRAARAQSTEAFVEDVGFTLIALFDGFVIVGSIDLRAPGWFVIALGVVGVLIGRLGIQRLKQRASGGFSRTTRASRYSAP